MATDFTLHDLADQVIARSQTGTFRNTTEKRAPQKPYSEKLKDPRWQKKRLEILNRDRWECRRCYDDSRTLHVHHRYYVAGLEPWEYDEKALVTLCEDCHASEGRQEKASDQRLLRAIKGFGFLSDEVDRLAEAFEQGTCVHLGEVVASALAEAIADPALLRGILDAMFERSRIRHEHEERAGKQD